MKKLEKKLLFYTRIIWLALIISLVRLVVNIVRAQWWYVFAGAMIILGLVFMLLGQMKQLNRFVEEHKDDWEREEKE